MATLSAGSNTSIYCPNDSTIAITITAPGKVSVNGRNFITGAAVTPSELYGSATVTATAGDIVTLEALIQDCTYVVTSSVGSGGSDATAENQTAQIALATGPANAAVTSVSCTTTSASLLASNTARKGASFTNDSTYIAYVLEGSGTASSTNYSFTVDPNGDYVELPTDNGNCYTGALQVIWESGASGGAMRVTETS